MGNYETDPIFDAENNPSIDPATEAAHRATEYARKAKDIQRGIEPGTEADAITTQNLAHLAINQAAVRETNEKGEIEFIPVPGGRQGVMDALHLDALKEDRRRTEAQMPQEQTPQNEKATKTTPTRKEIMQKFADAEAAMSQVGGNTTSQEQAPSNQSIETSSKRRRAELMQALEEKGRAYAQQQRENAHQ